MENILFIYQYDVIEFIKYVSSDNNKYILKNFENKINLLISLLENKITKIIINYYLINEISFNNFIFFLLKCHFDNFIIYPTNINIIHFILFNNLDIDLLLNILIIFYYIKDNKIEFNFQKEFFTSFGWKSTNKIIIRNLINHNILNLHLINLINKLYEGINNYNININFNINYNKLLFEKYEFNTEYQLSYFSLNNDLNSIVSSINSETISNIDDRINNLENSCKIYNIEIKDLENNLKKLSTNLERIINYKFNNLYNEIELKKKNINELKQNINNLENMIRYNNSNFLEFKKNTLESYVENIFNNKFFKYLKFGFIFFVIINGILCKFLIKFL
jgi:hypothetical protein